jgi:hypothetical protein
VRCRGSAFAPAVVNDHIAFTGFDAAVVTETLTTGLVLLLGDVAVVMLRRRARNEARTYSYAQAVSTGAMTAHQSRAETLRVSASAGSRGQIPHAMPLRVSGDGARHECA